jgi:hypothetical protein
MVRSFQQGSSNVLPYELEAAQTAGDKWSFIGDLSRLGGQIAGGVGGGAGAGMAPGTLPGIISNSGTGGALSRMYGN